MSIGTIIKKPTRKLISDYEVCLAYQVYQDVKYDGSFPPDILSSKFNLPIKLCESACERSHDKGLLEYGTSLRSGWLTDEGLKLAENGVRN